MSVSLRAAGHLLALSPMVLLVAGVIFGAPWFVFAFFFGVLPMVRMLLPDDLAEPAEIGRISRMQFIFLKSIPLALTSTWVGATTATVPRSTNRSSPMPGSGTSDRFSGHRSGSAWIKSGAAARVGTTGLPGLH
jgi:hypothetical protein